MSQEASPTASERLRYLAPSSPVIFPEEEEVPETQLHLDLRTLLYHLLKDTFTPEATVGSDQFVYFDAEEPKRCVAPDVYLGFAPTGEKIRTWKTWERGAPALAIEIVSDGDASEPSWQRKLIRYRQLGVQELIRFDPQSEKQPFRIWDRVKGALSERDITGPYAPSLVLDLSWVLAPAEGMPQALRFTKSRKSTALVPTRMEARQVEVEARSEVELRNQELEAEIQRLRG